MISLWRKIHLKFGDQPKTDEEFEYILSHVLWSPRTKH